MPKTLASRPMSGAPARGRTVAACLRCGRSRPIQGRGLCAGCYARDRRVNGTPVVCTRCGETKPVHGRGVCLACYQEYRRETRWRAAGVGPEISAADRRARELDISPVGDCDVPPPPDPVPDAYAPHAPFARRREASAWWRAWERAAGGTHPDTEPGRIAADQAEAVRGVLRELGPGATAAEISAAVILPVSVVERRLLELEESA